MRTLSTFPVCCRAGGLRCSRRWAREARNTGLLLTKSENLVQHTRPLSRPLTSIANLSRSSPHHWHIHKHSHTTYPRHHSGRFTSTRNSLLNCNFVLSRSVLGRSHGRSVLGPVGPHWPKPDALSLSSTKASCAKKPLSIAIIAIGALFIGCGIRSLSCFLLLPEVCYSP